MCRAASTSGSKRVAAAESSVQGRRSRGVQWQCRAAAQNRQNRSAPPAARRPPLVGRTAYVSYGHRWTFVSPPPSSHNRYFHFLTHHTYTKKKKNVGDKISQAPDRSTDRIDPPNATDALRERRRAYEYSRTSQRSTEWYFEMYSLVLTRNRRRSVGFTVCKCGVRTTCHTNKINSWREFYDVKVVETSLKPPPCSAQTFHPRGRLYVIHRHTRPTARFFVFYRLMTINHFWV